jgi:hypothetical protein
MQTKTLKKYVLTYGVFIVSLCILTLYRILDKASVFTNIFINKEIIQFSFTFIAVLFMLPCPIYMIKNKEWPRIGMPSVTGIGATIFGWIFLFILIYVEIYQIFYFSNNIKYNIHEIYSLF